MNNKKKMFAHTLVQIWCQMMVLPPASIQKLFFLCIGPHHWEKQAEEEEAKPTVLWKAAREVQDKFISFSEESTYMNAHNLKQLHSNINL